MKIVGEALLRVSHALICARRGAHGGDRHGHHATPRCLGSARASCAASCRTRVCCRRARPPRRCGRWWRMRTPGQAAIGTLLAARIYGGTVIRERIEDREDNETRFVWLAGPAAGDHGGAAAGARGRRVEDLGGVLGRRRRASGLAGALPGRVRPPGHQPDEDRVAPAARGPGQLHVLRRPGGARRRTRPWRRRSRGWRRCARRCACSAPTARRRSPRSGDRRRTGRAAGGARLRARGTPPLDSWAANGVHSPTRAGGVRVALRAPAARTWHIAERGDGRSGARPERHV